MGRLTIIKMSIFSKSNNRFNSIQIVVPARYCIEIYKIFLKLTWKYKCSEKVNNIEKSEKLCLLCKIYIKMSN